MRRHTEKLIALALLPGLLALAACGGGSGDAERAVETRGAIARAESTASRAAAMPATGLWTEEHLMDRLVRTGVLPRALEGTPPPAAWMQQPPIALSAGGGEVYVWIYADSVARKRVTDALDATTATPAGSTSPFALPMAFVVNNNLAAVISGGTERNQERITLALQAGLPVRP